MPPIEAFLRLTQCSGEGCCDFKNEREDITSYPMHLDIADSISHVTITQAEESMVCDVVNSLLDAIRRSDGGLEPEPPYCWRWRCYTPLSTTAYIKILFLLRRLEMLNYRLDSLFYDWTPNDITWGTMIVRSSCQFHDKLASSISERIERVVDRALKVHGLDESCRISKASRCLVSTRGQIGCPDPLPIVHFWMSLVSKSTCDICARNRHRSKKSNVAAASGVLHRYKNSMRADRRHTEITA